MKKFYILLQLSFLLLSGASLGREPSAEEKRRQKKQYVMKLLLQEEKALADRLRYKHGPDWRWRFMKLQMEKYKLVREDENDAFMNASMELRMKKKKSWFFRKTNPLYKKIRKEGLHIVKKWPKFSKNTEVYYALAANALNHNDPVVIKKEMGHFLVMALKRTSTKSPLAEKILASLAEHHYNQKQYAKAIHYYQRLFKRGKGQWHTKHLFNFAWCYLQLNRPQKALQFMQESLALSRIPKVEGQKNYIDYSEQVINALPLFFSRAGKVKEGVDFFVKEQKDPRDALKKMAQFSKETGGYGAVRLVYNHLLQVAKKRGEREEVVAVRIMELDLFLEFKKYREFRRTLTSLLQERREKDLPDEQRLAVVERLKTRVGKLQAIFHKSQHNKKKTLGSILFYFDQLQQFDPEKTAHYSFYRGESLFAVGKHKEALQSYMKGVKHYREKMGRKTSKSKDGAKPKEDEQILKKTFDAMFASLNKAKLPKKINISWNLSIYNSYLSLYPRGEKSRSIYQRLFNIHFRQKDLKGCQEVLARYVKHYPLRDKNKNAVGREDHKKQQFMLGQILNTEIKKKNIKKVTYWLTKLQQGYLEFDAPYVNKITRIRSDIIFDAVLKEKNPALAIPLYRGIYQTKEYPALIRGKAAYYIGFHMVDLFENKGALPWFKRTLSLTKNEERSKFQESILSSVQKMVYAQDFTHAYKLADVFLDQMCSKKISKKSREKIKGPKLFALKNDFFHASIFYAMVDGKTKQAYKNLLRGEKCGLTAKAHSEVVQYMVQFALTHHKAPLLNKLLTRYQGSKALQPFFAQAILGMYWGATLEESTARENLAFTYLKKIHKWKLQGKRGHALGKEIAAVMDFYQLRKEIEGKKAPHFIFHLAQKKFDEKRFNKNLENHLAKLGDFTKKMTNYINMGYPLIVSYGHHVLSRRYERFGRAVLDFRPKGVDQNYKKSFLQTMSTLGKQFLSEAKQQRHLATNLLNKKRILSPYGSNLSLGEEHVASVVRHRHPASLYGLTVDKTRRKK